MRRESRQPARTGDIHVIAGGDCLPAGRDQVGVVRERDPHRIVLARRQGRKRRRRGELTGRMADHLAIGGLARRKSPLCRREVGAAELESGFRLGDVGSCQIADLEAVGGRFEVGLQHLHIVLVQFDDRAVPDHVHVCGDGLDENVAFHSAQRGPPRFDPRLSRANGILDRAAAVQRDADLRSGRQVRTLPALDKQPALRDGAIEAHIGRHPGPTRSLGDCDGGIGCLQRFALAGERRVGAVG